MIADYAPALIQPDPIIAAETPRRTVVAEQPECYKRSPPPHDVRHICLQVRSELIFALLRAVAGKPLLAPLLLQPSPLASGPCALHPSPASPHPHCTRHAHFHL